MIYQLYYKNDHKTKPFNDFYIKFDLSLIKDNIYLPQIQNEYVGMCYMWKNNIDNHTWIGFTSCRQKQKNYPSTINQDHINLLSTNDIISWGWICSRDPKFGNFSNLYEQAEYYHPKMMDKIKILFSNFDEYFDALIKIFTENTCGAYCNYWMMNKNNFDNFMSWSYPMAQYMIQNPEIYLDSNGHCNMAGFIIERLFIYWYVKNNKTLVKI